MTDSEIQEHIENNCRNGHGEPAMDEQSFYEGAKWYRDKVLCRQSKYIASENKTDGCSHDETYKKVRFGVELTKCKHCRKIL